MKAFDSYQDNLYSTRIWTTTYKKISPMTRRNDFSGDGRFDDTLDVGDVGHHEAAFSGTKSIAELFNWKSGLIATDQVPECHVTRT